MKLLISIVALLCFSASVGTVTSVNRVGDNETENQQVEITDARPIERKKTQHFHDNEELIGFRYEDDTKETFNHTQTSGKRTRKRSVQY